MYLCGTRTLPANYISYCCYHVHWSVNRFRLLFFNIGLIFCFEASSKDDVVRSHRFVVFLSLSI